MTARVEPPAEYRGARWHWLVADRAAFIASWVDGGWEFAGIRTNFTPETLAREGYRYLAPALPPGPRDG